MMTGVPAAREGSPEPGNAARQRRVLLRVSNSPPPFGFMLKSLGFRVQGFGLRSEGLGLRFEGLGLTFQGSGFLWFRVIITSWELWSGAEDSLCSRALAVRFTVSSLSLTCQYTVIYT